MFEQVSKFERKKILNFINYDLKAEVFNELTDHVLDEIINIISSNLINLNSFKFYQPIP